MIVRLAQDTGGSEFQLSLVAQVQKARFVDVPVGRAPLLAELSLLERITGSKKLRDLQQLQKVQRHCRR